MQIDIPKAEFSLFGFFYENYFNFDTCEKETTLSITQFSMTLTFYLSRRELHLTVNCTYFPVFA